MSLRRVGILLGKEFLQDPKNYIFTMAVVLPIVLSLAVTLAFGTLFTERPKLGIVDEGSSRFAAMARELSSIDTKEYGSVSEIREAVERGSVDLGVVLPQDLEISLNQGQEAEVTVYVWGESLAKNRIILGATLASLARDMTGQETSVEIVTIALGDEPPVSWNARLFPLIVLLAVFFGGIMLPATSLVLEKEKKTLKALIVTPITVGEIFVAKGLVGIILSLFAGIVILVLNQAFGNKPALLALLLALGAIMAAAIGLLLGVFLKDLATLFTIWKSGGILLFAPAFVYLFPEIPEWVAKVFPTYYLIQPIIAISQSGGDWSDIANSVYILVGLNAILVGCIVLVLRRVKQHVV